MEISPQTLASLTGLGAGPKPNSISPFSPTLAASSWDSSHTVEPSEWSAPDKFQEVPAPQKGPRERRSGGREGNTARFETAAILSLLLTEASASTKKGLRLKRKFTQQGSDPAGLLDPVPGLWRLTMFSLSGSDSESPKSPCLVKLLNDICKWILWYCYFSPSSFHRNLTVKDLLDSILWWDNEISKDPQREAGESPQHTVLRALKM